MYHNYLYLFFYLYILDNKQNNECIGFSKFFMSVYIFTDRRILTEVLKLRTFLIANWS